MQSREIGQAGGHLAYTRLTRFFGLHSRVASGRFGNGFAASRPKVVPAHDRQWQLLQIIDFRDAFQALGLKHVLTKPYTPKPNGKAERFIQTALREWAYAQAYPTSERRA
jgi:hypothetical protein